MNGKHIHITSLNHLRPVKWRVVSHFSRSRYILDIIELPASGAASEVVKELGSRYYRNGPRLRSFLNRMVLFRKPMIGVASLAPISIDLCDFNYSPGQVIVSNSGKDEVLTQAFKHPELLKGASSFLYQYRMFEASNNSQDAGSRCLMMSYGLDRSCLAVMLLVVVVVCLAIGVIAGVVSNRIDVGFLFGCGTVTFLTSVQVTIFWVFR